MNEELPNITGALTQADMLSSTVNTGTNGAITINNTGGRGGGGNSWYWKNWYFNAANSNSIYSGATVTPSSLSIKYFIKY